MGDEQAGPPAETSAEAPDVDAAAAAVEEDISTLVAERDEYRTHALRLQADFENFRKRADKRLADELDRQTGRLVAELLPVLDACEAAAVHHPEATEPLWSALYGALRKQGLEAMDALGHPFDPELHEAVVHEPGDGGPTVVSEVLRTGYRWRDKVLRAAMVKVKG
jgi:molecular chaperone GrpE